MSKVVEVAISPGKSGSPGISFKPDGDSWDLSGYGEVAADITNTSSEPLSIFIRIDNAGDWHVSPWDMDRGLIPAGKTGTVKAYFGYSWGNAGYALDRSKVIQVLLFTNKPKEDLSFQVDAIRATGKVGDRPAGFVETVKPTGGVMVSYAGDGFPSSRVVAIGATAQDTATGGAKAELVTFTGAPAGKLSTVSFKAPDNAVWDLSAYDQAEFYLKNPGTQPVHVFARVDNPWANATDNCAVADATIAPRATSTVIVPFGASKSWDGSDPKSGGRLASDHVVALSVFTDATGDGGRVEVAGVKASVSASQPMPDWLGQRPPVPGNWTQTLNENFDGPALDAKTWDLPDKPEASVWDSSSVQDAQNAIVEGGMLKIKTEKPAAMPFDDPALKSRKYVTSVVTSYGKFAQKYGYFEARMKLPDGLGMWPAFWLMPDRGPAAGNQWKRQDTKNGGMEFDILEYLARFGPHHYNIAMHWDGYGMLHKATGSENVYFQPDKDGFITAGLLWGPQEVTFYCNGKEVGHWKNDRIGSVPEYIMFTQPVGGWGTNGYVDESKLPQYFQIDYVRVWQKDDWKNIPDGPPLVPTPALPSPPAP